MSTVINGSGEKWMIRAVMIIILTAFLGLGPTTVKYLLAEDKEIRTDMVRLDDRTVKKETYDVNQRHIEAYLVRIEKKIDKIIK